AGREVYAHRAVAELDGHAVGGNDVALRLDLVVAGFVEIPVCFGHHHACTMLLQDAGAAGVVRMRMADDYVADFLRVDAQFLQATDDFILDRVVEDGVDEDDAAAGTQTPDREGRLPEEEEIVEYPHWL